MNDTLQKTLKEKSTALALEATALLAEQERLNSLRADVAAREFEASEAEAAMNEGTACKLLPKLHKGTATPEERKQLAQEVLPAVNARARYVKASKEFSQAADSFIKKAKSLSERQEAHVAQVAKFIEHNESNEISQMTEEVEKIAGLISFGLATGTMPEAESWKFCQDIAKDFRDAKTAADKRREFRNFCTTFCALPKGGAMGGSNPVYSYRAELEKLKGAAATEFYNKHRAQILAEVPAFTSHPSL